MAKQSYIFSADVIRTIAIIAVVAIHTVNAVHARADFLGGISWWVTNLIESAARISIPLFIMLSGYLILQKDESFSQVLKRTTVRILLPLFVWLFIYLVWGHATFSPGNLVTFPERLFTGGALHLYFLIIMAGLYCVSPLLQTYFHKTTSQVQMHVMIFTCIVGIVLIAGQYIFGHCYSSNSFTMWIPYLGYFVGGYVLGNRTFTKKTKSILLIGAFFGFIVTSGFNFLHLFMLKNNSGSLQPNGCISPYFDHYLSPNVIAMSVAAFILLMGFNYEFIKKTFFERLIRSIARASLGIYLVHILVIQILEFRFHVRVDGYHFSLLPFVLFKWFLVFFTSYMIVLVCLRIPVIKKAFGGR